MVFNAKLQFVDIFLERSAVAALFFAVQDLFACIVTHWPFLHTQETKLDALTTA